MGGNGLIPFKRLLWDSLFQQQENWDGCSNSPVVSADYDTNPTPVFDGHVHYRVKVSTCGSSKLKTFNAQGKRSSDMTNVVPRKMRFLTLVQHRVQQHRKRRANCFQSYRYWRNEEKGKSKKVIWHCLYLRNSIVLSSCVSILLPFPYLWNLKQIPLKNTVSFLRALFPCAKTRV